MTEIPCKRCWKIITKKWPRVYCIKCRQEIDKQIAYAYRQEHIEEIRAKNRERARAKSAKLKRDE